MKTRKDLAVYEPMIAQKYPNMRLIGLRMPADGYLFATFENEADDWIIPVADLI